MDFRGWLLQESLSAVETAIFEGIEDLGPDAQEWLHKYLAKWGEKAARSASDYKRINWTMYWSRPENLAHLKDLVADKIIERGYDKTGFDLAARQYLTHFISTIFQKNVGFGSRRNMASVRRQDAEPDKVLHPGWLDASGQPGENPLVPKSGEGWSITKKHPTQAERWKQYRAQRELSKYPVVDPESGEVLQRSVVPGFRPMGGDVRRRPLRGEMN